MKDLGVEGAAAATIGVVTSGLYTTIGEFGRAALKGSTNCGVEVMTGEALTEGEATN